jgi:C4-type Zn-finger protein
MTDETEDDNIIRFECETHNCTQCGKLVRLRWNDDVDDSNIVHANWACDRCGYAMHEVFHISEFVAFKPTEKSYNPGVDTPESPG